jgi:hypothetical protein
MAPTTEFLSFAAVGALAQLVDGALGMAYGVASAAMLLALGVPPVTASASVHQAEAFTCGASGLSHWLAGNVRWPLFWMLAIPGVVGAVSGAAVLVHVPATWMRLALAPYLLGMGVFLLLRGAPGRAGGNHAPRGTPALGLAAGFADAVAGGGWSALTVTTLIARGATPRTVIGTVHLAKCVVSVAASVSFLWLVGLSQGTAVLGLIAGGVVAAPVGAVFARRMPARLATVLAAIAVLGLGVNNVVKAFG